MKSVQIGVFWDVPLYGLLYIDVSAALTASIVRVKLRSLYSRLYDVIAKKTTIFKMYRVLLNNWWQHNIVIALIFIKCFGKTFNGFYIENFIFLGCTDKITKAYS